MPRWSHNPEEILVDQPEYEVTKVPLTSISLVTARTIKVKRRSITKHDHRKVDGLPTRVSCLTLWHMSTHLGGSRFDLERQLNPFYASSCRTPGTSRAVVDRRFQRSLRAKNPRG